MNSKHDKPRRLRLRFSIRTLIAIITLVCCYAACWGPTKTKGVADVRGTKHTVASVPLAPLLLRTDKVILEGTPIGPDLALSIRQVRQFHFWFFGFVAKLPYQQEIDDPDPQASVSIGLFEDGQLDVRILDAP